MVGTPYAAPAEDNRVRTKAEGRPLILSLLVDLYQSRKFVLIVFLIFFVASSIIALSKENRYQSEAVLSPTQALNEKLSSSFASQIGGLGSLAGIDFGSESATAIDKAIATLHSRRFIQQFTELHKLKPELAPDDWDSSKKKWKEPGALKKAAHSIKRIIGANPKPLSSEPSEESTYGVFLRQMLHVTRNSSDGLIKLRVSASEPELAQIIGKSLIVELNKFLRDAAANEAMSSINLLEAQLKKTNSVELERTLFSLLESESKKMAMTKITTDYALSTIDPPSLPEAPSYPNRILIILIGCLASLVVSSIIIVGKRYLEVISDSR